MNEILKIFFSLSVSGSIIALILFGLKPFLKDKFSKTWQYYIWLIVIIRMLLPFSVETNIIGVLFSEVDKLTIAQNEVSEPLNYTPTTIDTFIPHLQLTNNEPIQQGKANTNYWNEIKNNVWLIWLGISIMLLVRKVTSYHSFVRYIKAGINEVSNKELLENFKSTCIAAGVKKPLKLYTNALATSAMLVGVFKPFVVVPNIEVSEKELHNIFIHELTHYKRLDILYKWFVQLAVCLHWYNPLVYLVSGEINKYCEFSCDETIIKKLDNKGKRSYGDTLLASLKNNGNYSDTIVSITLNEDAKLLKERLSTIMAYKTKSKFILVMTSFLTISVLCGATITGAYAATDNVTNTTTFVNKLPIENSTIGNTNLALNQAKVQKTNMQFSNEKIDTIKLNVTDCSNVIIQNSNNESIQYEYYESLYDISPKINDNELSITITQKPNVEQSITGNTENFICISLPNYIDKKITINAINSGLTINERNINNEIFCSNSMAIIYIPNNFDKSILCTSENGSVITHFNNTINNYTFTLSKDDNSFATLPSEFTNFLNNNAYKYTKGNGMANINISLKSSYFTARFNNIQNGSKEQITPDSMISQPNSNIAQNIDKNNAYTKVDNAAITLLEYSGNWEIVENHIPNMSKDGVDKLVEIYNQKNQYSSLAKKKASDYYNLNGTSADARALALIEENGTWKFSYVLFPYMTNDGIDKVVEIYNQRHKGKEKLASDYYNQ